MKTADAIKQLAKKYNACLRSRDLAGQRSDGDRFEEFEDAARDLADELCEIAENWRDFI